MGIQDYQARSNGRNSILIGLWDRSCHPIDTYMPTLHTTEIDQDQNAI